MAPTPTGLHLTIALCVVNVHANHSDEGKYVILSHAADQNIDVI